MSKVFHRHKNPEREQTCQRDDILGFHLIELLIAMAIVGILLSIAMPVYTGHINTASRANAMTALSGLAIKMEEYHLSHNTYQGVSLAELNMAELTSDGHYRLQILHSGEDYILSATHITNDSNSVTLDSSGQFSQTH